MELSESDSTVGEGLASNREVCQLSREAGERRRTKVVARHRGKDRVNARHWTSFLTDLITFGILLSIPGILSIVLDNVEFTWSMMPQDTAIGGEEDGNSGETLKLMLNLVSGGAGMSNCCEAPLPVVSTCIAPSLPGRDSETLRGDGRREEST